MEDKIEKISQYKVTLKGMKMAMNETDPSNKIEDPNLEIHRKNIAKIIEKFKDIKKNTIGPSCQASALQSFIQKVVEDITTCGIIRQSTSPHNALIHLAKKKGSGYRMCLDFCQLNTITTKDKFPLP